MVNIKTGSEWDSIAWRRKVGQSFKDFKELPYVYIGFKPEWSNETLKKIKRFYILVYHKLLGLYLVPSVAQYYFPFFSHNITDRIRHS